MLTRVDPVADQAAMAGQVGTAAMGDFLLAVLLEVLEARALATLLVIPSVASSAVKARGLVPRMTWRHPSPERRASTRPLRNVRERRSSLHLHGADSLVGPKIFHSATGFCSSLPGPDSALANPPALVFRATPFSSVDDFNCFAGGFFFNPFFIGRFSESFVGSSSLLPFNDQMPDYVPDDSTAEVRPAQPSDATGLSESRGGTKNPATNNAAPVNQAKSEQPVTLLQLRDGSMYGLVAYWVEDGQLHYTTTYGGQNSLELDRIDLEKTVQLNAERGIQFVLHPNTPPR
jgi:hypothetical protein